MSNILIVEDNQEMCMLVKLNLMGKFNSNIYEKINITDAIDLIEILDDFDLIICRDFESSPNNCENIGKFLMSNYKPFPMVAITSSIINYGKCKKIENNVGWEKIVEIASEELGTSGVALNKEEFLAVPASYFLAIESSINIDIYIRLKKTEEGYQYIKRVHAGEKLETKDVKKYIDSGLKEFYVKREQFNDFVSVVTLELTNKLTSESIKGEERLEVNEKGYNISREMILSLGVDNQTIELVKNSILSMEKSLKEEGALGTFLSKLNQNQDSFSFNQSYLSCLLMNKLVVNFEWYTSAVKEKISYVAFFHDISLGSEEMSLIRSKADLENSRFSSKDKMKINSHAIDSAQFVDKFSSIPMGVSSIIREHHGSKTGYGFVDEINLNIAPLSMIYVVVEHFVADFISLGTEEKRQSKDEIRNIFEKLRIIYNKSTYLQTIQFLEKMSGIID
jgi:hypothetical protein